jgi:hypothetical protein
MSSHPTTNGRLSRIARVTLAVAVVVAIGIAVRLKTVPLPHGGVERECPGHVAPDCDPDSIPPEELLTSKRLTTEPGRRQTIPTVVLLKVDRLAAGGWHCKIRPDVKPRNFLFVL